MLGLTIHGSFSPAGAGCHDKNRQSVEKSAGTNPVIMSSDKQFRRLLPWHLQHRQHHHHHHHHHSQCQSPIVYSPDFFPFPSSWRCPCLLLVQKLLGLLGWQRLSERTDPLLFLRPNTPFSQVQIYQQKTAFTQSVSRSSHELLLASLNAEESVQRTCSDKFLICWVELVVGFPPLMFLVGHETPQKWDQQVEGVSNYHLKRNCYDNGSLRINVP